MNSSLIIKAFRTIKAVWIALGAILVFLVFFEIFCQSVYYLRSEMLKFPIDTRVNADSYPDRAWANDYWKEVYSLQYKWGPYVCHRMKPFSGRFFHIDSQGIRSTWNSPVNSSNDKIYNIVMLGGSTMWGLGVSDNDTIPSLVAKLLARQLPDKVHVVNLSQMAYQSTQELLTLMNEIRYKRIPNIVIFYDGVNEVSASDLNKSAGTTLFESTREEEFRLFSKPRRKDLWRLFVSANIKNSSAFQVFSKFMPHIHRGGASQSDESATNFLAEKTISWYLSNLDFDEMLAQKYDFSTLYYWQPVINFKSYLTPYEKKSLPKDRVFLEKIYNLVDKSPELNHKRNFHNLSRIFENYRGPIYLDDCHTSKNGNEIIAEKIATDVIETIKRLKHKIPST